VSHRARALVTTAALSANALLGACTQRLEVLSRGTGSDRPLPTNDAGAAGEGDGGQNSLEAGANDGGLAPLLPAPDLLYRFDERAGTRVLDSSSTGALYHLTIADPTRVTWLDDALRIDEPTILSSSVDATELPQACKQSQGLSIEAWIVPAESTVVGTRRIISMSSGTSERNFLLGQGGLEADGPLDSFSMRLRTSTTDNNGLPILLSAEGTATTSLTHVVATHAPGGSEHMFVNGAESSLGTRSGSFDNWDDTLRIHVGNELDAPDDTRAFLGELHRVAVYCATLSATQVADLFARGSAR